MWVLGLETRTKEPKGRSGLAPVSAYMSYFSPLAVLRPWNLPPYQVVFAVQTRMGLRGWLTWATKGAPKPWATRNINGSHRRAAQTMKSRLRIVSPIHRHCKMLTCGARRFNKNRLEAIQLSY